LSREKLINEVQALMGARGSAGARTH
jgi:hypothetical protein